MLLTSARALASDGSSALITEPLHASEAEEDQAATIRNIFGSEGYVDDVNTSAKCFDNTRSSDLFGTSVSNRSVPFTASIRD
jgi:hypothetical protein